MEEHCLNPPSRRNLPFICKECSWWLDSSYSIFRILLSSRTEVNSARSSPCLTGLPGGQLVLGSCHWVGRHFRSASWPRSKSEGLPAQSCFFLPSLTDLHWSLEDFSACFFPLYDPHALIYSKVLVLLVPTRCLRLTEPSPHVFSAQWPSQRSDIYYRCSPPHCSPGILAPLFPFR